LAEGHGMRAVPGCRGGIEHSGKVVCMSEAKTELWLVRHGETDWSLSGAHTSFTDIPLTEHGRVRAKELAAYLKGKPFAAVLSSPMQRAQETCRLAGMGDQMQLEPDLKEWNYGAAEGKSTRQMREELQNPQWSVWTNPVQEIGGESVEAVGVRADHVIERALAAARTQIPEAKDKQEAATGTQRVALFAHAHILRILAARWIGRPAVDGRLFALGTGSVSVLGFERETRVITRWNRELESE
jgi:broad specificity phosphatase PhoE